MIHRPHYLDKISIGFESHSAVALLGPRQCGKTTLARLLAKREESHFFDLESSVDRRRLENPELALSTLKGLIIIDEIQRIPSLFETLRVLIDRQDVSARFLLLGSASPDLVKGVSESLSGRVAFVDLSGFDLNEIGPDSMRKLWIRGGFPRSFLAKSEVASQNWRGNFIRSFLERDIPQLGINIATETLSRFWTMIAHYHGQVWNGAEFARSLGASEPTARRYLDILSGAFMVRILPPWHENLKKRQLKSPKIYIRDTGLLHSLLETQDFPNLLGHPKLGASWEGFAIEQILTIFDIRTPYFWATHAGAELDLLITLNGKRYGIELKHSDAPNATRSMRTAIKDLSLQHLWVIYPGSESYPINESITVLPLSQINDLIETAKHLRTERGRR